jgi:hypothetical protein
MQLRRDHERDRAQDLRVAALRAQAPETTKLEGLIWSFAEMHVIDSYERVAAIAATVSAWADKGHNVNAPEALIVVEAAFLAAGIRL